MPNVITNVEHLCLNCGRNTNGTLNLDTADWTCHCGTNRNLNRPVDDHPPTT